MYKLVDVLDRCIVRREVSDVNCAELKKACQSLVVLQVTSGPGQHHTTAARSVTFMPPATKRQAATIAGHTNNTSNSNRGARVTTAGSTPAKRESAKRNRSGAAVVAQGEVVATGVVEKEKNVPRPEDENILEDDLEDAGALEDDKDADFALIDEEEEDDDFEGVGAAGVKSAPKPPPKRQKLILDSDDEDEEGEGASKPTVAAAAARESAFVDQNGKASARKSGGVHAVHAHGADGRNEDSPGSDHVQNGTDRVMSHFGEAEAVPSHSEGQGEEWGEWPRRHRPEKRGDRTQNLLEDDDDHQDALRGPCDDGESIQRSAAGAQHQYLFHMYSGLPLASHP